VSRRVGREADQLDPDAEVAGVVAVPGVVVELLGALLEEPGKLLPQLLRRKHLLHLPNPPKKPTGESADGSNKEKRKGRRTGAMGEGDQIRRSAGFHPPPTRGAPSPAGRPPWLDWTLQCWSNGDFLAFSNFEIPHRGGNVHFSSRVHLHSPERNLEIYSIC
jgi:hypothetical protein